MKEGAAAVVDFSSLTCAGLWPRNLRKSQCKWGLLAAVYVGSGDGDFVLPQQCQSESEQLHTAASQVVDATLDLQLTALHLKGAGAVIGPLAINCFATQDSARSAT